MVITGFLGGYTTFSTFENDTLILWERGEVGLTAANVIGSVVAGFVAVVLGTSLARGLANPAVEHAAAAARRVETIVAERTHDDLNQELQSIFPRVDLLGEVGGDDRANEESQP